MLARFHRSVQSDLNEILVKYRDISDDLEDNFFVELQIGIENTRPSPRFSPFDASGLRRCNLQRFPDHFLYDIRDNEIRI